MNRNINKAFWEWFGNSQIKNDDGFPIVCYHGSYPTDIVSFLPCGGGQYGDSDKVIQLFLKAKHTNSPFGFMNFRSGTFFSPDPTYASDYTNEALGVMYPVYIKAENPLYFNQITGQATRLFDPKKTADALVMYEGNTINEIGIILPTQVKSIFNQGTWSPDDPHIGR